MCSNPLNLITCGLLLIIAFLYRAIINRGQTWGTPDELAYSNYASSWGTGEKYLNLVVAFLSKVEPEIPPTRFGFFSICSILRRLLKTCQHYKLVTWVAAISGALIPLVAFQITHDILTSLLVASSPLSLLLSRRALQDTFSALVFIFSLFAVAQHNIYLFWLSVTLTLSSREAFLLYLPAICISWGVCTGSWLLGGCVTALSVFSSVLLYYILGGRYLVEVLYKLRGVTDYVRRFQSGFPHRVIVDLVLVSPATVLGAVVSCIWAPSWLVWFIGVSLGIHSFVIPKNVRFLLIVDVSCRMCCAWLPGFWPCLIFGLGTVFDFFLYRSLAHIKDPTTYNLIVKTGMYLEK